METIRRGPRPVNTEVPDPYAGDGPAGWRPVARTCRYCGIAGKLFARPRTSAGGHRDREVRCLMCHISWYEEDA